MKQKHFLIALGLLFTFFTGAFIGQAAGFNPVVAGGVLTALSSVKFFFTGSVAQGLVFNSFDVSGITGYASENKKDLISTLINGLDIVEDIQLQPNVKQPMKMPKLLVGNGVRPFSSTTEFGNGGDIQFTERELVTKSAKREGLMDISEFFDTYLRKEANAGNGSDKTFDDFKFAGMVWEEIIKAAQREVNDETAYFGFDKADAVAFDAGDPYAVGDYVTFSSNGRTEYFQCVTITSAGESPTTHPAKWLYVTARAVTPGIKSLLDAAITGGFAETTTGAISDGATALNAFRELFRDMPIPYQRNGVIISASYNNTNFLLDGIEDKLTKYTTPEVSDILKAGLIPLPGTNNKCFIKPATWLGASNRLIAGPMDGTKHANIFLGTDLLSDLSKITTKANLWTLEYGIKFDLGFQIADLNALRLGDQE